MTAIESTDTLVKECMAVGRLESVQCVASPLHADQDASPPVFALEGDALFAPTGGNDPNRDITLAKMRFSNAVSQAMSNLMINDGYSREHAMMFLLRLVQCDDYCPQDNEIFGLMKLTGIGSRGAVIALTVARAVKNARTEPGSTPARAIEGLTTKLKSDILQSRGSLPSAEHPSLEVKDCDPHSHSIHIQKEVSAQPTSVLPIMLRKPHYKNDPSPAIKKTTKSVSRKRLVSELENKKVTVLASPNQITHGDKALSLELDIAKKSKLSIDGQVDMKKDAMRRNKTLIPTVMRVKRNVSHLNEDTEIQADQTSVKRARL